MAAAIVVELAARHGLDAADLVEAWTERAAIREYLAGYSRQYAEVAAVHDVESMYAIGLRCPATRAAMAARGDRRRPAGAAPMVHARLEVLDGA